MRMQKNKLYSLSVGLLLVSGLVASSAMDRMSPSDKSMKQHKESDMQEKMEVKDRKEAADTGRHLTRTDRKNTTKSLSGKNKRAFYSLSSTDQRRVMKDHKNGSNPHEALHNVLKEDASRGSDGKENSTTPASRAIQKHNEEMYG